jgi:hypothetical protein
LFNFINKSNYQCGVAVLRYISETASGTVFFKKEKEKERKMNLTGTLFSLLLLVVTSYGYLRKSEELISQQNDTLWNQVEGRMRKLVGSNCLLVERGMFQLPW